MEKWDIYICAVTETVKKYLQDSYALADRVIQSEWIFFQPMKKDMGQAFAGLEKVMRGIYLPRLFFVISKTLPPVVVDLSTLSVNKFGLVLNNPMPSENDRYNSLIRASCNMIGAVTYKRVFSTADHIRVVK